MNRNSFPEGAGRTLVLSRRDLVLGAAGLAGAAALPRGLRAQEVRAQGSQIQEAAGAEDWVESHGMSAFGDLKHPADFPHFDYVNPHAPRGGLLSLQIKRSAGNQNFDTFNTLNVYVLRGDGAAGMGSTFDALMSGTEDEPDSMYGLVARAVQISPDKLVYRFLLRPEARFHDGSRLTAHDAAFSLRILKEKGHPSFRQLLSEMADAQAEGDEALVVTLAPTRSRDVHLAIAGMPIFSQAYWANRDFEASTLEPPLGSGPYRVARFEQGRYIEFERVPDYWAKDLPVAVGFNNFDRVRYEYFRDRQVAFEAFKSGVMNFHEEFTSRIWATGYDFPAMRDGRVKRDEIPHERPAGTQGWHFNLRRQKFADPRVREAIGLAFDFEWTNQNIMFSSFTRLTSYFDNSPMKAEGPPSPEELALLEPFRGQVPDEVFGEPWVPPVSDGSGQDRALLRRAHDLLREAGCTRAGAVLHLPTGEPLTIEFLDSSPTLQPHSQPFQKNLGLLGIQANSRIVDAAQYQRRMDEFDFDMASRAMGASPTPGDSLRLVYGSEAAVTPGSRNISGIAHPAIDSLIARISNAQDRDELTIAARALDRVLRAGRYWVPMWYRASDWLAYWDVFGRPQTTPAFSSGAPGTWWYDPKRGQTIGRG